MLKNASVELEFGKLHLAQVFGYDCYFTFELACPNLEDQFMNLRKPKEEDYFV